MLTYLLTLAHHLSAPVPAVVTTPDSRMAILQTRLDEIKAKQEEAAPTPAPKAEIKWPLVLARLAASVWFTPLVALLETIRANDMNLAVRTPLVIQAVSMALRMGLPAGFRIYPTDPDTPVAYIVLPTGQVSWVLPQQTQPFDSHTPEQKYQRCEQLAEFALLTPTALTVPPATPTSQV